MNGKKKEYQLKRRLRKETDTSNGVSSYPNVRLMIREGCTKLWPQPPYVRRARRCLCWRKAAGADGIFIFDVMLWVGGSGWRGRSYMC